MHTNRRFLVKAALAGVWASLAGKWILFKPRQAYGFWPEPPFKAKTPAEVIAALHKGSVAIVSDRIQIEAPDLAEDGTVVPVKIRAELTGVESISIIAEKNPVPLVACFKLSPDVIPSIATRIKLAGSSHMIALVEAQGKLYTRSKFVKVVQGGCG